MQDHVFIACRIWPISPIFILASFSHANTVSQSVSQTWCFNHSGYHFHSHWFTTTLASHEVSCTHTKSPFLLPLHTQALISHTCSLMIAKSFICIHNHTISQTLSQLSSPTFLKQLPTSPWFTAFNSLLQSFTHTQFLRHCLSHLFSVIITLLVWENHNCY